MKQEARCLITGCTLFAVGEDKQVYGDLYVLGDVYIFNAIRDEEGDAYWHYTNILSGNVVSAHWGYFELRGVIVFKHPVFSDAALEYLNRD